MKRKYIIIPLFILIVTSGLLFFYLNCRDKVREAYVQGHFIDLAFDEIAQITSCFVEEGDEVRQGDLLFQLDSKVLSAKRTKMQKDLTLLKDEMQQTSLEMERALDEYLKAKQQEREESEIKLKELEEAQIKHKIATSKKEVLEGKLNLVTSKIKKRSFYAPFDSCVSRRHLLPGDIAKKAEKILTLYEKDHFWIEMLLKKEDLKDVRLNDEAAITLPSFPHLELKGKVFFISSFKDEEPVLVKLSLFPGRDIEKISLRPGTVAKVKLKGCSEKK